jgi:hypothetical protein
MLRNDDEKCFLEDANTFASRKETRSRSANHRDAFCRSGPSSLTIGTHVRARVDTGRATRQEDAKRAGPVSEKKTRWIATWDAWSPMARCVVGFVPSHSRALRARSPPLSRAIARRARNGAFSVKPAYPPRGT